VFIEEGANFFSGRRRIAPRACGSNPEGGFAPARRDGRPGGEPGGGHAGAFLHGFRQPPSAATGFRGCSSTPVTARDSRRRPTTVRAGPSFGDGPFARAPARRHAGSGTGSGWAVRARRGGRAAGGSGRDSARRYATRTRLCLRAFAPEGVPVSSFMGKRDWRCRSRSSRRGSRGSRKLIRGREGRGLLVTPGRTDALGGFALGRPRRRRRNLRTRIAPAGRRAVLEGYEHRPLDGPRWRAVRRRPRRGVTLT